MLASGVIPVGRKFPEYTNSTTREDAGGLVRADWTEHLVSSLRVRSRTDDKDCRANRHGWVRVTTPYVKKHIFGS